VIYHIFHRFTVPKADLSLGGEITAKKVKHFLTYFSLIPADFPLFDQEPEQA
jgi:hypothetical protein